MKRLAALILALALTLAAVPLALAEEYVYARHLPQQNTKGMPLLTEETYPQVCLTTSSEYSVFGDRDGANPLFLCFPGPEGASATSFSYYTATYLDPENNIQYVYYLDSSNSFEEFVNKAEKDEYVVLDGSTGMAGYINPSYHTAYGMLSAKEFGKSAKLRIEINYRSMSRSLSEEEVCAILKAAVLTELNRVRPQMLCQNIAPYWNSDRFSGVKLLNSDYSQMAWFDFPSLTMTRTSTGETFSAPFCITKMSSNSCKGVYYAAPRMYITQEFSFSNYSYASNQYASEAENSFLYTSQSGSQWYIYLSSVEEDGNVNTWYASMVLPDITDSYGKQMYFSVSSSYTNISEDGLDECQADVETMEGNLLILDPAYDPYVPPVKPVATPVPTMPDVGAPVDSALGLMQEMLKNMELPEGAWLCPGCGRVNNTNFCPDCGAARP